jgi:hypothetical protein
MTNRAYLYFALTFILGVVVGAAASVYSTWHGTRRHLARKPPASDEVLRHLSRDLQLSDQQASQIKPIIEDSIASTVQLQTQVEPQFRAIRDQGRERIRKFLTPEQTAKFNELVRRHEERLQRERSR